MESRENLKKKPSIEITAYTLLSEDMNEKVDREILEVFDRNNIDIDLKNNITGAEYNNSETKGRMRIRDIYELKELASRDGGVDLYIALNGGLRSTKEIFYHSETKMFSVFHSVDGEVIEYTLDELLQETNIGKAIVMGSLFKHR